MFRSGLLEAHPSGLGDERVPTLVDGRPRAAESDAWIPAHDPATGAPLAAFPAFAAADVDAAVAAAQRALPAWRSRDPQERADLVDRLADAIDAHADTLALLDALDTGSPLRDMRRDVDLATAQMRYLAGLALQVRGETIPGAHAALTYTRREPFGVVARLLAFNHPLMFAATKLVAPLVTGNTLILKPSEHTSQSTLALADLIAERFPPGVVNVVTGTGAEAGDALVAHPAVRRLSFIGGVGTGMAIQARAAGVAVKHVTLELGGKNPLVVFPDADLDEAVDAAVRGMNFTWQGQSCGSTSRVFVDAEAYEPFVERLGRRVGALRPGAPTDPASDTGALVNAAQLEKVLRYIAIGRDEGAGVVTGGERLNGGELAAGNFVAPTVFRDVDPAGRLAQEEIFGPVLAAIPYRGYDEAVALANGVEYGLTAGVFTSDLGTAHAFARDVEAGYVWVNEVGRHIPGAPFGGIKNSGIGREEDLEELESFTQTKTVHLRFPPPREAR